MIRLLLVFALSVAARAEPSGEIWELTIDFEIFQVPQELAVALIPRFSDDAGAVQARRTLNEKSDRMNDNEVTRIANLIGRAPAGHRVSAHEGEERRYCVEYENEDHRIGLAASSRSGEQVVTGYPSTTFETRLCGAQLDARAQVSADGRTILMLHQTEYLEFEDWLRYQSGVRRDGVKLQVEQPIFRNRRSVGAIVAASGTPVLVGSFKLPGEPKRFELHVITANAQKRAGKLPGASAKNRQDNPYADQFWNLPEEFPMADVRAEVIKFSVPAEEAIPMRPRLMDREQIDQALTQLLALSARGRVELLDWQTLASLAAGVGNTENLREIRFAIEDAQGSPPVTFGTNDNAAPAAPPVPPTPRQPRPWLDPRTNFETRSIGTKFEAGWGSPRLAYLDPMVEQKPPSSGDAVPELSYRVERVLSPGHYRWGMGPDQNGKASYAYYPQFHWCKTAGLLPVKDNKPLLLSFDAERGAPKRFEITLMRVHLRPMHPPLQP